MTGVAPIWKPGNELPARIQSDCKRRFVHRFTGEHKPAWALHPAPNGKPYAVQFKDDADWLANTSFAVTRANSLDERVAYCESAPTWPHNPELRKFA
jgi:hypothetical protein